MLLKIGLRPLSIPIQQTSPPAEHTAPPFGLAASRRRMSKNSICHTEKEQYLRSTTQQLQCHFGLHPIQFTHEHKRYLEELLFEQNHS